MTYVKSTCNNKIEHRNMTVCGIYFCGYIYQEYHEDFEEDRNMEITLSAIVNNNSNP